MRSGSSAQADATPSGNSRFLSLRYMPPAHMAACMHPPFTQSSGPCSETCWWPAAADKLERRAAAVRLQVAFTGALAGSLLSVTAFVEEALHCYRSRSLCCYPGGSA